MIKKKTKTHKVSLVYITTPTSYLMQTYQITKEGQRRDRYMPNLSETIEVNEKPLAAAVRGLKEELGIYILPTRLIFFNKEVTIKPSPTTNKIKQYIFYKYSLRITEKEADNCNLIADEGECFTYFKWYKL